MEEIPNPESFQKTNSANLNVEIKTPPKKKKNFINDIVDKFKSLPQGKKTIIIGVAIVIFITVSALIAFAFIQLSANKRTLSGDVLLIGQGDGTEGASLDSPKPSDIKDQESPINGVLYTTTEIEELEQKYPLAIVVENHTAARPQSGLDKADVVYEFLAEGGITRMLAIYWGKDAEEVGPVRSARKYMVDMLSEYDSLFMHIGWAEGTGNTDTDAASYIYSTGTKSFLWGGYYWRSSDRIAPHNAYTETSKLWEQAIGKGWTIDDYSTTSWIFKNDVSLEDRPLTSIINISFSSSDSYDVMWSYDRDANSYLRSCGGETSIDKVTGAQLDAKTVIVQEVDMSYPQPADDKNRIILDIIGENKVTIFQDGESIEGTWKKSSRTSRTKFYDSDGNEIAINRGKVWIEMIPRKNDKLEGSLTYN